MKLPEVNKSGVYVVTNTNDRDNQYLVLISGHNHFLKIETVWDLYHNTVEFDDLRGKSLDWTEIKLSEIIHII